MSLDSSQVKSSQIIHPVTRFISDNIQPREILLLLLPPKENQNVSSLPRNPSTMTPRASGGVRNFFSLDSASKV